MFFNIHFLSFETHVVMTKPWSESEKSAALVTKLNEERHLLMKI